MNTLPTRRKASAVVAAAAFLVGVILPACGAGAPADAGKLNQPPAAVTPVTKAAENFEAGLAERFKVLSEKSGGQVGVAVVHVESGRSVAFNGESPLPLFSVFKLPLAVAVLKDVEEGKLKLDQKVRVTPAEAAPGARANTELWAKPVELTVVELIGLSISRSDNTSSDKLLELVGGPSAVTARMRALGLRKIDIRATVKEFAAGKKEYPNTGAAEDLARLLVLLQKGEALREPQQAVLLGAMERATTGLKRLRGDLPPGTPVADKTGTGDAGKVMNDVGIITLPEGRGRLAMAVLVNGSKLSAEAQEKLIAELARAAYDAHTAGAARTP